MRTNMEKTEIVLFETEDKKVTLLVPVEQETVWLNRNQMAELFDRDVKTIGKHINNVLKEELDNSTVAKFATVQNEGGRDVEREIEFYDLDMIIKKNITKRGMCVYSDQIEHTARRFSAWLPPIQCTLSGHQCMMIIQE